MILVDTRPLEQRDPSSPFLDEVHQCSGTQKNKLIHRCNPFEGPVPTTSYYYLLKANSFLNLGFLY